MKSSNWPAESAKNNPSSAADSRYFSAAEKMEQALIALMKEKPFAYITVSEICRQAGVNRSTFYLHYENSSELLAETSRALIDGFLSCFPMDAWKISNQFADCEVDELFFVSEEYLRPYLTYIKENALVFSTVLSHGKSFEFEHIFARLFQHIFNPILNRFHYPAAYQMYVMRFYLNGIHAVICEWLSEGCRTPVDEMMRIIRACIFGLE